MSDSPGEADVLYSPDGGAGFHGSLFVLATAAEALLTAELQGGCDIPSINGQEYVADSLRVALHAFVAAHRAFVNLRFPNKFAGTIEVAKSFPTAPAARQLFQQLAAYWEAMRLNADAEAAQRDQALNRVFAGEAFVTSDCFVVAL